MKIIYFILFLALFASDVWSQRTDSLLQKDPGPYTVEASLSAGPMVSLFRELRSPVSSDGAVFGSSVFGRVMWHPSRLISFGVASGYVLFSREDFSNIIPSLKDTVVPGSATITAIPLQVAGSMQKYGFELGIAVGPYLMMIELMDEDVTRASRFELGMTSFASYKWNLNDNLYIGPQLRCIYMAYHGILSFVAEFSVQYNVLTY